MNKYENLGSTIPKVAHFYPDWLPITMSWLYNLIQSTSAEISNHILCYKRSNSKNFQLEHIHTFSDQSLLKKAYQRILKKIHLTKDLLFYENWLSKNNPTLIHSHFGHIGAQNQALAELFQMPHLVSFYGMDVHAMSQQTHFRDKYKFMLQNANLILCEGPFMLRSIINLGAPPEKTIIHHLGIDLEKINFNPRSYNLNDPLKILIAASFREKKAIPLSLQAIGEYLKKHNTIKIEVTLVGDAAPDELGKKEKEKIIDIIKNYNLQSNIRMTGYIQPEEFVRLSLDHHIFLSPSITAKNGDCEGGAPVSLIEMSASGMLIISSTHCDIPNVIVDNKTGLLAKENCLEDLINKLEWAIDHRDHWFHFQNAGRKYIEENFNIKKQSRKLINLYKNYY